MIYQAKPSKMSNVLTPSLSLSLLSSRKTVCDSPAVDRWPASLSNKPTSYSHPSANQSNESTSCINLTRASQRTHRRHLTMGHV